MISVCMPIYNGEKFLKPQIESILLQLNEGDELVIADDNSTDNSLAIAKSFNDKRIKILESRENLGVIFNVERALHKAKGDIIFLSDQDDIWKKNKIEVSLKALEKADLILHDAEISIDGILQNQSLFEWRNVKGGFWKNLLKNSYTGCCMAFKRSLLEYALPFPKTIPMHDMWLGLLAEKYFRIVFVREKLITFRRHGGNFTQIEIKKKRIGFLQLKYRLNLFFAVINRIYRAPKTKNKTEKATESLIS